MILTHADTYTCQHVVHEDIVDVILAYQIANQNIVLCVLLCGWPS